MSTLAAVPTIRAFLEGVAPPPPVVVLLADTDIMPSAPPPLLNQIDIRRRVGAAALLRLPVAAIKPNPSRRTPRPTSPKSPSRRATSSPLTSDDDEPTDPLSPVKATLVKIPRPLGVQSVNIAKAANLEKILLKDITAAVATVAPEKLNLNIPRTSQDKTALASFNKTMHNQFPVLDNYEDSWVLTSILTTYLKNTKPKLIKAAKDRQLQQSRAADTDVPQRRREV
ncbi:hypothetical protein FB451DRAFT_1172085 [Mycena latifolia]|nr:hypothetical protein FB451DRAFT_1172085 [Mycena latifolia]